MPQLLEGRTILVSGVGMKGGVGTDALDEIRKQGGKPIITCYPKIAERAEKFRQGNEMIIPCDFSRVKSIASLCETLRAQNIMLDGFLHSVANAPKSTRKPGKKFMSLTVCEIMEGLMLNAISFHQAIKYMMGNGNTSKRILNNGAVCVTMTFRLGSQRYIETYFPSMAANKALLDTFATGAANELGPQGVRVHSLDAGPMKTAAARGVEKFDVLYEAARKAVPSRRNMTTEDAVWGICLLMSPRSEMFPPIVTMDGGLQQLGVVPVNDSRLE